MGLFSVFSKTEVNEYIASRSKARPEGFSKSLALKPRHLLRLSVCLGSNTSRLYSPGSGADGWSTHSGEKGQPGDATLEESAENLRGGEMLLSGAQGLFERSELTGAPLCT